jgi:hypothetical protein
VQQNTIKTVLPQQCCHSSMASPHASRTAHIAGHTHQIHPAWRACLGVCCKMHRTRGKPTGSSAIMMQRPTQNCSRNRHALHRLATKIVLAHCCYCIRSAVGSTAAQHTRQPHKTAGSHIAIHPMANMEARPDPVPAGQPPVLQTPGQSLPGHQKNTTNCELVR